MRICAASLGGGGGVWEVVVEETEGGGRCERQRVRQAATSPKALGGVRVREWARRKGPKSLHTTPTTSCTLASPEGHHKNRIATIQ